MRTIGYGCLLGSFARRRKPRGRRAQGRGEKMEPWSARRVAVGSERPRLVALWKMEAQLRPGLDAHLAPGTLRARHREAMSFSV